MTDHFCPGSYDTDLMDAYRHGWLAWRRITDNLLIDPHLTTKGRAQLQQLAETQWTMLEDLSNQQDPESHEEPEDGMGLDDYLEEQLAEEGDEDRYDNEPWEGYDMERDDEIDDEMDGTR